METFIPQQAIDAQNAHFWNELCGSSLAQSLGITEASPENLCRFDEAYMAFYPYLSAYVLQENIYGKRVLEIGLGYGTLGQLLVSQGCDYYGLDIAQNPVDMMRYRLAQCGQNGVEKVQVGSALAIPHGDASFDYVYSIGCLHHTGDLLQAIAEVHRVLRVGGRAIIMLYHRHSFRQLVQVPLMRLRSACAIGTTMSFAERVRALYDTNKQGEAAPHTDYVSRSAVKTLFKKFAKVQIDQQNFDTYILFKGKVVLAREKFLKNLGRIVGLDLYVTATK